jgi:ubiquinone/menaquinone biosynthesis C-methylase UbiE
MNKIKNIIINILNNKTIKRISDIYFNRKKYIWKHMNVDDAKLFWDSRNDEKKNNYLSSLFEGYKPRSILEIGCNCGNKLYPLALRYPDAKLFGLDINHNAIEYGKEKIKEEGIQNIILQLGTAIDMTQYSSRSMDVVFSWATLIYILPKDIASVLSEMYRVTNKSLIILEMHSSDIIKQNEINGIYFGGNWKRNYIKILTDIGIKKDNITEKKIEIDIWHPSGGDGSLIIANKSNG